MNALPIITLQVQQMKHTVAAVLAEHTAMLDQQVQLAIDDALQPENVEGVIRRTVQSCVNEAVTQEIQSFFLYSNPGRKAIKEAVLEHLESRFGERP